MKPSAYLNNKSILVTGGTGTFGRAFVARLLKEYEPREIVVFSRDEFKQFEMAQLFPPSRFPVRYFIGDIRDRERLLRAFNGIDIVVHAAALKQVPALEANPMEAVKTNIIGAQNIIEAALDRNVKRIIGVSTDKAVSPSNLYGATKLAMEKLLVAANTYTRYRDIGFSVVRYGNVTGSRGSVIPFWSDLIRRGETTLPVTDTRMTRFLIDLGGGVDLVLRAIEHAEPGEIFVPKIPSTKMMDLVKAFPGSPEARVVGIRPGEKLHEVLISEDEGRHTYDMGTHFVIVPEFDDRRSERHAVKVGRAMPDGFSYRSDNNGDWLTHDALVDLVNDVGGFHAFSARRAVAA
ncbi:UDP-N-acetylglucosamine 4,6-dehydratase (inverting) [Trinickia symbiotica]|uniref:UDP-N-acetylglucosamine 4,6-dehydratase (Inverting) n=1 Tax=Trinickia symbiotica TaxID=863227 RepID=A0A2T3XNL2_9BURK|nr:UDP-N-acetylglucosamine 4,6-dehydratase (inverting) [Trinickia symbiotica]PTB18080.1 UDP-N-acetylglucosamine 4,6-dehydratase (inverting) [Trinickia symbiotica]